ncbi:hypothetical protein [Nocardia sp. R7R-8]
MAKITGASWRLAAADPATKQMRESGSAAGTVVAAATRPSGTARIAD